MLTKGRCTVLSEIAHASVGHLVHDSQYNFCDLQPVMLTIQGDHRAAVRESDGVDYVFNFAGRISATLLSLLPDYGNVRARYVEGATWSSDLCAFHRTLDEFGELLTKKYKCVADPC